MPTSKKGFTPYHFCKIIKHTVNNVKNVTGFTLIELLVVISIISILSVVGFSAFTNVTKSARDAKRRADIDVITKAYEVKYDQDNSQYKPLDTTAFTSGTIPKDPTTTKGYYYNWLDTDKSGFRVCASLEASGNIPCTTSAAQCYCKDSTQGKVKLSPTVGAFTAVVDQYGGIYTVNNSHTDLGPGSLNPAPSCDKTGTLTAGLVGYWKMDVESGNIVSDSSSSVITGTRGSRAGTDATAPIWESESQCKSGRCLQFNGTSDAVDLGDYDDFNPLKFDTNNWSVSAWFRATSTGTKRFIYGLRTAADHDFSIGIGSDNKPYIEWVDNPPQPGYITKRGPSAVTDGNWHQIGAVRSGGTITLYLDGDAIATDTTVGTHDLTGGNWFSRWSIGAGFRGCCTTFDAGVWQDFFKGYIDDVRIYNRALSGGVAGSEISNLYSTGSGCIPQ